MFELSDTPAEDELRHWSSLETSMESQVPTYVHALPSVSSGIQALGSGFAEPRTKFGSDR